MEIDFIPVWFANVWRLALWLVMLRIVVDIAGFAYRRETNAPAWATLCAVALAVLLARSAFVQALRWEGPVRWDGLPVTTVAVVITLAALRGYRECLAEYRAQAAAGPPADVSARVVPPPGP